ncbi:MAG: insulinase family protein [Planctomycetaceae bacterium]|nr:insulinase family protein [Planctomycetaceae bacterium]
MNRFAYRASLLITVIGLLVAVQPAHAGQKPLPYTNVRRLADQVTVAKLSNGLTIIVQENHAAPVATVRCFVKNTGSAFEGKNLGAGVSHVLEHVVSGGTTTHRDEKEIQRIINQFGGATNAFTSTDMTVFYIDCPAKNATTAIELVADAMQHVAFKPAEFERELKVVRRELADNEVNRGRALAKLVQDTVYTTHPARYPVIGYLDILNRTTNQTIIDFYHSRYVPENQVFVVVGDVDAKQVLDQVAKQFAGTPRGQETYVPFEKEPEQLSPRESVREMDGATYDLALVWPTVKLSNPDLYALDVAAYILGEGESSRLVERLRNQQRLVMYVGAMSDTPHYVNGMFGVMAVCPPETWQKASDAALTEVYRLRDELVGPAELAKAKKQKAAELVLGRQTVQQAADGLGRNYIGTADPLFDKTYVEGIQKVTAEQVRDVARRYFVPERLNRIIITPPGGTPKPAATAQNESEGKIRLVRLPNGLRVLLKRDSRLPLVNMQAFVLGGSLADDEKTAGRASLVAAMLDRGAKNHSAEQIADYFDSIGAQMSMGAGRFTVFGSLTTLRSDFPAAAALFAECFTRPAFPESEFAKIQQLGLRAVAARANSPQEVVNEFFCDSLPADSPYHVIQGGKPATLKALTADDLRAYHARYFVPNNMVVAVFGDIDPEKALALVEKQFGGLRANPNFQPPAFNRPNTIEKTIVRHKTIGQDTGIIRFGYPTASIFDKKDYAAMTLLDAIISGYNSPSGWLFEELRGAGLVYAVDAAQMTGPVPGYFIVVAQTQPSKIDEVVSRIEKNIDRAKAGKITKDEFHTAAQMVVALHAQEDTTMAEQARQAAVDELYGLGYDYRKTFDARIQAVSLDDVVAAARKYLGNHVLVTGSPAKN